MNFKLTSAAVFFIAAAQKAAIDCFAQIGLGDKILADQVATFAMRQVLNASPISALVKIGEGEMDQAPMLFCGEKLGLNIKNLDDEKIDLDIAVDPLEGTNLCAQGFPGALTTIAFAQHNSILKCPDIYMRKLIVSPGYNQFVSLNASLAENLNNLASAKKCNLNELKIIMLNRPRHMQDIQTARSMGVKVVLINDGDIGAGLNVLLGRADMYVGIGGAPEGVLSAAAAKGFGADVQMQLVFENELQRQSALNCGIPSKDLDKIYSAQDLIKGDCIFIACGVTDGDILGGVSYDKKHYHVETLLINSQFLQVDIIKTKIDVNSKFFSAAK